MTRFPRCTAGVALLVLILAACGSSGSDGDATATTPTTAATTVTSGPTTAAPAATSTTVAPTTAPGRTIPADAPVASPDDAILAPPSDAPPLALGGADPCRVLTGTASLGGCGVVEGAEGKLVWFTSDQDSPDPTSVMIYKVVGGALVETLELPEALRDSAGLAHVEVADLDGVAGDELVVGSRDDGSGAFLELDIVGGAGTVVGHVTLDHGKAVVSPGVVDIWAAEFGPDDPNCCPADFAFSHIVFADGRYRIVSAGTVPTSEAPPGDFP